MEITVPHEASGKRLDTYLSEVSGLSRSFVVRLVENGCVSVNGKPADKHRKLEENDSVVYTLPEVKDVETKAEDIPLSVVYEDADVLVVDKPSGMVVHPAAGNEDGTLVNALLHHCRGSLSGINGEKRPGIVHRIDKDTSGLLAVAKNDAAHLSLAAQLEDHSMYRLYHAVVAGHLKEKEGVVDAPIGRHPKDRKKMAVLRDGQGKSRRAVTHYRVIEEYPGASYVALRLETGRTHQIRVHMAHLGHPLLGDTLYGGGHTAFEKKHPVLFSGQCLHAKELTFRHPRTGEKMTFTTPLPPAFEKILSLLRNEK